jgi:TPR repeat protein
MTINRRMILNDVLQPQDLSVAKFRWYRKAAEHGNDDAQLKLGDCYYDGNGVGQDYDEALKWFRKAAEQENPTAQRRLGECYYCGYGVKSDYEDALSWFRKAAEQGDNDAARYLATAKHHPAILVVLSDERITHAIVKILQEKCRAQVLTAADNASALRHLHQSQFDLIIQDRVRPGGGAIELLRAVRGDTQLRSVRVIVLSTFTGLSYEKFREFYSEGAEEVVIMPFESIELLRAVSGIRVYRQHEEDRGSGG